MITAQRLKEVLGDRHPEVFVNYLNWEITTTITQLCVFPSEFQLEIDRVLFTVSYWEKIVSSDSHKQKMEKWLLDYFKYIALPIVRVRIIG